MPSMLGRHTEQRDVEHIAKSTEACLDESSHDEKDQNILFCAAHCLYSRKTLESLLGRRVEKEGCTRSWRSEHAGRIVSDQLHRHRDIDAVLGEKPLFLICQISLDPRGEIYDTRIHLLLCAHQEKGENQESGDTDHDESASFHCVIRRKNGSGIG